MKSKEVMSQYQGITTTISYGKQYVIQIQMQVNFVPIIDQGKLCVPSIIIVQQLEFGRCFLISTIYFELQASMDKEYMYCWSLNYF